MNKPLSPEQLDAINFWMTIDPDLETQAELRELMDSGANDELADRFAQQLEFGTAGLRGELGAGPNRMNRVVVARAAHAIGQFLLANRPRFWAARNRPLVVIGFDGRRNSDVFAKDSAEILAGLGIEVQLFAGHVPTPVLAFTGHAIGSSASIMVTASHNPPRDNGYKVYLGGDNGGSQLTAPDDSAIARIIESSSRRDPSSYPKSAEYKLVGLEQIQEYVAQAAELVSPEWALSDSSTRAELRICHTSLHGVGWQTLHLLFAEVGFSNLHPVAEQMHPDPLFPTVSFPNPEELGAMDLSYQTASRISVDIILANDPDADRLAVALPTEDGWQMLSGDQVGLILGRLFAERHPQTTQALASSIVSSPRLGQLASARGLRYQQTLTGFKWISKVQNLGFGYEEALGYCVDPQHTPDKDGITAALLIADLAAALKERGETLWSYLREIDAELGAEATGQIAIRVTDLSLIAELMSRLRENPPLELGGESVSYEDLRRGTRLPATDGIILSNLTGLRVIVRPSGTEPKLKCYLSATGVDFAAAEARLTRLRSAMQQLLN